MGAAVIVEQMRERERERIRQLELQDQEREAMLAQIEQLKHEEVLQQQAKKEAGKKLLEEVALANAEQIRLKKKQAESEREEEARIALYLQEKAAREEEHRAEVERVKADKERETQRLRAMQEKAQDKQAALDELRAKRAAEEAERTYRRKEKAAAERQAAINEQLSIAREQQKLEKERRLAQQAMQEKEEFDRIKRVQYEQEAEEQALASEAQSRRFSHKGELLTQISMNAGMRQKGRTEFLEQGNQLKSKQLLERKKLEVIKDKKLVQLQTDGVPGHYLVDLERKRFS